MFLNTNNALTEIKNLYINYYAPFEVIIHNKSNDCWVTFLEKVYNITQLIEKYNTKNQNCFIQALLVFAGKDISDWFDERSGNLKHYIHPITRIEVPYIPHGRMPDVKLEVLSTLWRPVNKVPWWKDTTYIKIKKYLVGLLTKRVCPIRIINMLTGKNVKINVCCEDTINRIKEKYRLFNSDADSYTWRYGNVNLDMNKTLEENGIEDERDRFAELGIAPNYYIPYIYLYYNDNFYYFDCKKDGNYCCPYSWVN